MDLPTITIILGIVQISKRHISHGISSFSLAVQVPVVIYERHQCPRQLPSCSNFSATSLLWLISRFMILIGLFRVIFKIPNNQ